MMGYKLCKCVGWVGGGGESECTYEWLGMDYAHIGRSDSQ